MPISKQDKLHYVEDVIREMMKSDVLAQQAAANTKEQFAASPDLRKVMMEAVVTLYERHGKIKDVFQSSEELQNMTATLVAKDVYDAFCLERIVNVLDTYMG